MRNNNGYAGKEATSKGGNGNATSKGANELATRRRGISQGFYPTKQENYFSVETFYYYFLFENQKESSTNA